MDTAELMTRLAAGTEPVWPLPRPWIRTAVWLALGAIYVALVVAMMSPRSDLLVKLSQLRYLIEQCAALATAIAAAAAAFASVVPGIDRKLLLLPVLPLAVWLGSLGEGCIRDWITFGVHGLSLQPEWLCLPAIMLVGAGPAIAIAVIVHRGAPLMPHATTALAGLAAAGLGNFGLRLFHPQDASLMVLVWQFGSVSALTAVAAIGGGYLLSWRSLIDKARKHAAIG